PNHHTRRKTATIRRKTNTQHKFRTNKVQIRNNNNFPTRRGTSTGEDLRSSAVDDGEELGGKDDETWWCGGPPSLVTPPTAWIYIVKL
ncbi:hypothetical protein A2U01_0084102, partial [Trifolium medium]|nr:hypothetical protein [Trifolium medium]